MADIKLEKISVYGFKSIRALENFEIRPLNVLIGANGAGKSNFIALFRLLNAIRELRLVAYSRIIGADNLLYYGRKQTEQIVIRLELTPSEKSNITGYSFGLIPTNDSSSIFEQEIIMHNGVPLMSTLKNEESRVFGDDSRVTDMLGFAPLIAAIKSWQIYHFHDTSETAKIKGRVNLHDNRRLAPDASNLAAFLYYLQQKHSQHYQQIVQAIQRVAPFFDDFVLEPLLLAKEEIRLEWRDKSSFDSRFTAHELSDGTLRFICLATLLLQPELPNLILIDEPELGLHPFAINLLADMLEIASQSSQVIVSTQSVPLVNQFSPEQIVVVDRKDGQSSFERPDAQALEAWLEEYGMGDLWEKNVLGGRPQREPQA